MAEIQHAGMFKQIVTALFVGRAVNRHAIADPPAQWKQPLNVIHMVVGQQKLLERSGRPAVGEIVQPGIDQGDSIVKSHHAAAGFTSILRRASGADTGRAMAAPGGHALCAAGPAKGERQAHSALVKRMWLGA